MKQIFTAVLFAVLLSVSYCDDDVKNKAVDCFINHFTKYKFTSTVRKCCKKAMKVIDHRFKFGTEQPFPQTFGNCISGEFNMNLLDKCTELEKQANLEFPSLDPDCLPMITNVQMKDSSHCELWMEDVVDCANSICSKKQTEDVYIDRLITAICEWVKI